MKLVGDVIAPDSPEENSSMFLSTLVHRASVAPPRS